MIKAEYVIVGVLAGMVAYNAYVMYCIRRDHPAEYDVLYKQIAVKYRNGALILSIIIAAIVIFVMGQYHEKKYNNEM